MNGEDRNVYLAVLGGFAVLLLVMMVSWDYDKANTQAEVKADELIALYEKRGLPVPAEKDQITHVLGDDAAVVCEPLKNGAELGALKSRIGVGGEFYLRTVRGDARTLIGLESIVQVYCPDELDDLKDFLDGFNLRDELIDETSTN